MLTALLLTIVTALASVRCDTPADCRYEDIRGKWLLHRSETTGGTGVNCSKVGPLNNPYVVELFYPDIAVDEYGNEGFWTLIYNQGFEIVVGGRKFFAFSKYVVHGKNVTSYCGETLIGWTHNVLGRNWGCYVANKTTPVAPRIHSHPLLSTPSPFLLANHHLRKEGFDKKLNSAQKSWIAAPSKLKVDSFEEALTLAGGRGSMLLTKPSPISSSKTIQKIASSLPTQWDWRNVSGINYLSPVRNQGSCGSCYAFASMAMLESRLRILTNNEASDVLSPQDVVECSKYSQGCSGGFPYLISGKYAEDFGVVEEVCNPYKGLDGHCSTAPVCPPRRFATKYKYVGGYYGGCSEEALMVQLVKNGPIVVGFQVYQDFLLYHGGIYHHVEALEFVPENLKKFYPFELTNHAVLLVGYGVDENTKEKYWIVKNSWGTSWGLDGYFKIRKGTDECGIESCGLESFPIL